MDVITIRDAYSTNTDTCDNNCRSLLFLNVIKNLIQTKRIAKQHRIGKWSCLLKWTTKVACFVGKDSVHRSRSRNREVFNRLESRTANRFSRYPTPGTILLSFLQFHNPDTFKTCALHLSQLSSFVSASSSGAISLIFTCAQFYLRHYYFSVRKNSSLTWTPHETQT